MSHNLPPNPRQPETPGTQEYEATRQRLKDYVYAHLTDESGSVHGASTWEIRDQFLASSVHFFVEKSHHEEEPAIVGLDILAPQEFAAALNEGHLSLFYVQVDEVIGGEIFYGEDPASAPAAAIHLLVDKLESTERAGGLIPSKFGE